MLTITARLSGDGPFDDRLILPFEQRQKSRMRVRLESGVEAALTMDRGAVLRGGDRLLAADGRIVLVVAAKEPVVFVTAPDPGTLVRAAYHLGNRHIPLQVGTGWLVLEQDHVLEHMLEGLGATIRHDAAPFEPESGAYGGGLHHDDDHGHRHDHAHSHLHTRHD